MWELNDGTDPHQASQMGVLDIIPSWLICLHLAPVSSRSLPPFCPDSLSILTLKTVFETVQLASCSFFFILNISI